MNHKHSLVFFSTVVIILVLGLFLMGMKVPMGISIPVLQQNLPMETNLETQMQDDEGKEFTKEDAITTTTVTTSIQAKSKSIEQMNCTELDEFIMSFENGWGSAVALYNEKCS